MKAWHNTNPSPEKNPELQALVRQAVLRMPAVTKIKEIADDPVVKELVEGKNTRLNRFSQTIYRQLRNFRSIFGRHSKNRSSVIIALADCCCTTTMALQLFY